MSECRTPEQVKKAYTLHELHLSLYSGKKINDQPPTPDRSFPLDMFTKNGSTIRTLRFAMEQAQNRTLWLNWNDQVLALVKRFRNGLNQDGDSSSISEKDYRSYERRKHVGPKGGRIAMARLRASRGLMKLVETGKISTEQLTEAFRDTTDIREAFLKAFILGEGLPLPSRVSLSPTQRVRLEQQKHFRCFSQWVKKNPRLKKDWMRLQRDIRKKTTLRAYPGQRWASVLWLVMHPYKQAARKTTTPLIPERKKTQAPRQILPPKSVKPQKRVVVEKKQSSHGSKILKSIGAIGISATPGGVLAGVLYAAGVVSGGWAVLLGIGITAGVGTILHQRFQPEKK